MNGIHRHFRGTCGASETWKRTPSHCSKKTRIITEHINTEKGPPYLGLSGAQEREVGDVFRNGETCKGQAYQSLRKVLYSY